MKGKEGREAEKGRGEEEMEGDRETLGTLQIPVCFQRRCLSIHLHHFT